MKPILYFSLLNSSGNEVYTSPCYFINDVDGVIDFSRVMSVFKFYFDRINSGIKQQLESPKTSPEQKASLKYFSPADYTFQLRELHNSGGYFRKNFWEKRLTDFSEMSNYSYYG